METDTNPTEAASSEEEEKIYNIGLKLATAFYRAYTNPPKNLKEQADRRQEPLVQSRSTQWQWRFFIAQNSGTFGS